MRIGVDARALFGERTGIGRFLQGMLAALARTDGGHEVILYAPRPIVFPAAPPRWRITVHHGVKGTNGIMWLQIYGPYLALRDRLDVLWGPAFHLPVLLPPRVTGIVTVHDLVHLFFPQTMEIRNYLALRTILPPSLRRAGHVTADSASTADALHEHLRVPREKISVVYPGVAPEFHMRDPAEARRRVAQSWGLDKPYLLTVATIEPRKNLATLLRVVADLPPAVRRQWPLVIAGGRGWKNSAFYAAAAPLVDDGAVRVLGYVSDEELPWLYAGADAFLFPSLYEGFGMPVVEAMACGVPVIVSDIPVLREVAADAAAYVGASDIAGWVSAIQQTLECRDRAPRRDRGIRRAAGFRFEESASRFLSVLEALPAADVAPHPSAGRIPPT